MIGQGAIDQFFRPLVRDGKNIECCLITRRDEVNRIYIFQEFLPCLGINQIQSLILGIGKKGNRSGRRRWS